MSALVTTRLPSRRRPFVAGAAILALGTAVSIGAVRLGARHAAAPPAPGSVPTIASGIPSSSGITASAVEDQTPAKGVEEFPTPPPPSTVRKASAAATSIPGNAGRSSMPTVPSASAILPAASASASADPAPNVVVVPALPAQRPPDASAIRRELEPRVWAGNASIDDIKMLKAICSQQGDHPCRNRAAAELKRKQEGP